MLDSSEDVINVIRLLRTELADIIELKEKLLYAMKEVEGVSQKSVENTSEISAATEEQATVIESILGVMKNIKTGIDKLSDALNSSEHKSVS